MAKDAVATMGGFLPDDAGGRDAVHVAVFSAVSNERLFPGQDISVVEQGDRDVKVSTTGDLVAIVDPFLKSSVLPGVRFWAYLYPRSITALSHRWSHPAFEAVDSSYVPPSAQLIAREWIRNYADQYGVTCDDMIDAAKAYLDHGDRFIRGGTFEGESVPEEFWIHFERATGRLVDRHERDNFYSCSC